MTDEEFREQRRKGIGGSDLAVILGISPFKKIEELWYEKVDGVYPYFSDAQKKRMEEGERLEPEIIKWCADMEGLRSVRSKIVKTNLREYMEGNFDATALSKMGIEVGIEAKTALYKNKKKDWSAGIPLYYQAQCWWYGMISGIDTWVVPVFFMENEEVVEKKIYLFYMQDFPYTQEEVFKKCDEFWDSVKEGICPMSHKDLKKIDDIERLMIEEYKEWSEKEKIAETRKKEISTLFKQEVKEGRGIEFVDNEHNKIATVYTTSRKKFDKYSFFEAHPELIKFYKNFEVESESVMFRLLEVKDE